MIVSINDLRYEGIHGVTSKERSKSQLFKVQLRAQVDVCPHTLEDSIEQVADYRKMREAVRVVIETEHHNLLETMAWRIGRSIRQDEKVLAVTITIEKPGIWSNGVPSVTITI